MFGLEVLDVAIGLMLVYLLLSLFATAINEYIATVLNLRGKELARGLGRLLDDLDEKDALDRALKGVGTKLTAEAHLVTERFYNHRLIRSLATRRGRFFRMFGKRPRLPSYIPARTFAMALLDTLEVRERDASSVETLSRASDAAPTDGAADQRAGSIAELGRVLAILKRESPLDVSEHLGEVDGLLADAQLAPQVKLRLVDTLAGTQTQLQKLHDSVEVWFNNAMDRVSGAYKRTVQGILFLLGIVIAACVNADTIQMWRQLQENDELRTSLVQRATATLPVVDTVIQSPAGDTLSLDQVRRRYAAARELVNEMDLKLGWTRQEAMRIGVLDSAYGRTHPAAWVKNPAFWAKLLGLLLTAVAISLGAPFWFDMLNKVISIRATGRSPQERPKSPEGPAKRAAEETTK